ncbi:pyruvate kinase [Bacteroidota bacterium]
MPQRRFRRRTKIVATIGPASSSASMIERLLRAGMDVARLNLSHGTHDDHAYQIQTIRQLSQRLELPVAIIMDLPGPKYRTGKLKDGTVILKKGARITLTTKPVEGDDKRVPVNLPTLPQDVKVGDKVLIDDGALQLKVLSTGGTEVNCRVVVGGPLTPGRGLVVPAMNTSGPFITEQLKKHIAFAIEHQPDYVALSFVMNPEDVERTRDLLKQGNSDIPIITKIERGHAVASFDRILAVSDGIMVARGDLGVDIPLEKVPLVQKEIINKCNKAGKPVITATQMLESMINSPRPTRAEVTDVANAIFDGTDAIMLSGETSMGKYPVHSVRTMSRIAKETETRLPYEHLLMHRGNWIESQTDEMISYNACYTAYRLGAAAIVAATQTGSTVRRISKYRPKMPIIALTPGTKVYGRLLLSWGVRVRHIAAAPSVDELFATAAQLCKEMGIAKAGDLVVITGGIPLGVSGTTNLLKVEKIT